jgi:hypothetical protein
MTLAYGDRDVPVQRVAPIRWIADNEHFVPFVNTTNDSRSFRNHRQGKNPGSAIAREKTAWARNHPGC